MENLGETVDLVTISLKSYGRKDSELPVSSQDAAPYRRGIEKAKRVIDGATRQLEREGFSKYTFFLGIINTVATSTLLFAKPAYFWIWYGLKCWILVPAWMVQVHKVYNGIRFVFDFCWVMAITFGFYMFLTGFGWLPVAYQRNMFLIFFSCATGPLGWACILLSNGIVFHSVEKSSSLFIHMTPLLTCWTIVVNNDEVMQRWPGRFPSMAELDDVSILEVIMHGWLVYMAWLVIHGCWLLIWGVDSPKKGQETVFNGVYKGKEKFFEKLTRSKNEKMHALAYLIIHMILTSASFFIWPPLCWLYPITMLTISGVGLFLSAAWNSASYYEYIVSKKYTKELHKLLNDTPRLATSSFTA
jgi:hypothetical protein